MFGKKKEAVNKAARFNMKHLQGLDIPEMTCSVELTTEKISIQGGGKEFSLNIDKISSVAYEMDIDVQKYNKSSIVAGVAGAVAFGTVGAVIGSAPRSKTKRLVTGGAVISYAGSDGFRYIIFQDAQPNDMQTAKFVDKLRPLIQHNSKQHIEL